MPDSLDSLTPAPFETLQGLFNYYENVYPSGAVVHETELRSISARISAGNHDYLAALSEKWGMSRSALAAQLLEAALNEIELRDTAKQQKDEHVKAQSAAL
jgi:hypothetical protein